MASVLEKYVPVEAIPLISYWLKEHHLHLRISKTRKTKLGDFRPSRKPALHRISVNGDLNVYHFLITLSHEVAHAAAWNQFQNKIKPHGAEWKSIYIDMLQTMMQQVEFPAELKSQIQQHLSKPKASSCSDPDLYKALKKYDKEKAEVFLEDLEEGSHFLLHGKRLFVKGKKRVSRFECYELKSKRMYYVSAHAEVLAQNNPKNT